MEGIKELFEDSPDTGTEQMFEVIKNFIKGKDKNHTFFAMVVTPIGVNWFAKNVDLHSPQTIKALNKYWELVKNNFKEKPKIWKKK